MIPFDITEYLDSDEAIAEYLSQVLEDGDNEEFIRACLLYTSPSPRD